MTQRRAGFSHKIFIIAAESSGDQLGSYLIEALKQQSKGPLEINGVGGSKMAAMGVSSPIDVRPLAVIGPLDGLLAYQKVRRLVSQTVQQVIDADPEVVVLIDSWGFTIRVAKEIRKHLPSCKLVKYVAPQVFATRPGRAKTTAQVYDHLLTIHSFDSHFFEAEGLEATFVGNSALFASQAGNSRNISSEFNPKRKMVLSVFFGSRLAEIKQLYRPFLDAIDIVKSTFPDLLVVSPLADSVATEIRALAITDPRLQEIILLDETRKFDVFQASEIALACSGTITLELANAGVPTVVGYRIGGVLGYPLQKLLFKAPFASLINLAADEAVFAEYLTRDCTGSNLAQGLMELLQNQDLRKTKQKKLQSTVKKMRGTSHNPSVAAAVAVLEMIN